MRNKIILLMLLSIITAFSYQESYEVLAHFEEIDVTFDECVPVYYAEGNDGVNEKWFAYYSSSTTEPTYHFYNTSTFSTQTIRYYLSETEEITDENKGTPIDELYSWDSYYSELIAQDIKNSFIASIKKWNDIYIYEYENGIVNRLKFVNIIEGSSTNHNVVIYPHSFTEIENIDERPIADSVPIVKENSYSNQFTYNEIIHLHFNEFKIRVNVSKYYHNSSYSYARTGAHEFGHIFGLKDLDLLEKEIFNYYHHNELLMGYGGNRQTNITYRDLSGAMITMGFHTSSDHKWMYSLTEYGGYKLICSICNGVKYSPTIPTGSVIYESCNGNHLLSSGNMMAVASYGTKDYYKCKYCRYVAPFELNVEQSYGEREYIDGNTIQHYAHSNNGLTYKVLENHFYDYYTNTFVPYPYNHAQYSLKHKVICGCDGAQTYRAHAFSYQDLNDGNMTTTCLDCGAVIISKTTGPGIIQPMSSNIWKVTDNGSYKLTNGIIILVEEDIQSYKEGTLVFNDANSEIM